MKPIPIKYSNGLKSWWKISRQYSSPTAATYWSTNRQSWSTPIYLIFSREIK
jgi:hypothetical protein